MSANRHGFRWTINECLRLQREFELLQLPLEEIASRHGRTVNAIMWKLHAEEFASYDDLCNQYYSNQLNNLATDEDEDEDEDDEEQDDEEQDDDYDPYNVVQHLLSLQKQMNSLVSRFTSRSSSASSSVDY